MQSNAFTQNTFQETQQQATGFGSKQARSGFSQAQQQQRQKQLDPFGQPQQHQQFAGFAQKQQQPDPFSRQQVQPQLSPTPPQQQHQRQQHQPNVFAQQPHVFAQPAGGFTIAQQNADPKIDPSATLLAEVSHLEVIQKGLQAMDATAITLCMDNDLPIVMFDLMQAGNVRSILAGDTVGTLVS